jgi:hypothetical protein
VIDMKQQKTRAQPGTKGGGSYFRIVLRPKSDFELFRYHDVGEDGGDLQRLAGRKRSGTWDTLAWLVSKDSAHIEGQELIPDTRDARNLIRTFAAKPRRIKGDVFAAKDRQSIRRTSH